MPNPDALGWLAAALMVATFGCREARAMRPLAVATNLAFIGYGVAASLAPVLTLHLLLLPINLWRWAEALRAKESSMKLRDLWNRSTPALALAACVVLAACGGGGGQSEIAQEPPLEQTSVKRWWKVWEVTAQGRDDLLLADDSSAADGDLNVNFDLPGGLAFVPQEYPGKSRPQVGVFARPGGMTFGAYADAPGITRLNDSTGSVGSMSLLFQYLAFRKQAPDATLEFVVSHLWADLVDDNGPQLIDGECTWAASGSATACQSVMSAGALYGIDVVADADRSGNSYETLVFNKTSEVEAFGWQDHFDVAFNRAAVLGDQNEPLWDDSDFNVLRLTNALGSNNRQVVTLRRPKVISIPLDKVPVGAEFLVASRVFTQAFNHRQRESFAVSYLRDPASTGGMPGTEIRTNGLAQVPIQSGSLFDPNADDTPECVGPPDPQAGSIGFESASYAEPEVPGLGAVITLVRSGGAKGQVSVRLRSREGTATPALDYEDQNRRLKFYEGQTRLSVRLPILLDPIEEGNETFGLELSEPHGCASLGLALATVTILDDDRPPPTPTLSLRVGGTVTGLAGSGLVLEDRARSITLPVAANGSFFFGTTYPAGSIYNVQVRTQPAGPAQVCTVTRGAGTVVAEVNDIAVDCVTPPAPVGLDPSFGGGSGTVTAGPRGAMKALALRPDGRIVAAIGNAVAQYLADGTLDTSFGSAGSVTDVLGPTSAGAEIYDIALQPDGRIVVAGTARGNSASTLAYDFAAARLNANGSRDTGFNGGLPLQVDWIGGPDRATRVLLQSDGRIVLAGSATTVFTSSTDDSAFAAVRLNVDGTLDTGFGNGGRAVGEIGQLDFGQAAVLQPDGRIVVAGRTSLSRTDDAHFGAVRFLPDGTLDASFGSGGTLFVAGFGEATAMAQRPDGKLVFAVAQRVGGDFGFGVVRLLPDGTADTTFGTGGLVTRQIGAGQDTPAALALQADGGIVLAGLWLSAATSFDFVVARFGPDGTPDPVFSFVLDFFGARDGAHDLLVQPDGKVLAAGQAGSGLSVFPMLLRLNP